MVRVELDPKRERRLRKLAKSRGQDASTFVKTVIEDYLDLESLPADREEDWAEASIAMAQEVLEQDTWDEGPDDGSR